MKWLITLLCALFLVACKPTAEHAEINFSIAQAPLNLDPRYATDAASERINHLIYQPLVDFDAVSKPAPVLASWQVVNSNQYRFTLNKNRALFHNQMPLTAQDVKATYDSLLALKDSPHTAEFANIERIDAEDENTVLFSLKRADIDFPAKLIIGILPKNLIQQGHDFSHHPVGNGPLKFVSWQK